MINRAAGYLFALILIGLLCGGYQQRASWTPPWLEGVPLYKDYRGLAGEPLPLKADTSNDGSAPSPALYQGAGPGSSQMILPARLRPPVQRHTTKGWGQPAYSDIVSELAPAPTDLFRRCAAKALAGNFGKLQPWQEKAYRRGWEQGVTVKGKAWVTVYGPNEGRQGRVTASGAPVSKRVAAANKIPRYSYVWIARTRNGGAQMRQVLDTGARRNDVVAVRKGARVWIDIWVPHANNWSAICEYAVIGE